MYSLYPVTMDIEAIDTEAMDRCSMNRQEGDRQTVDAEPLNIESVSNMEPDITVVSCLKFVICQLKVQEGHFSQSHLS